MTNYEAIKAMGMNELAGFLASITINISHANVVIID